MWIVAKVDKKFVQFKKSSLSNWRRVTNPSPKILKIYKKIDKEK